MARAQKPAPPGEPAWVARAFKHDPLGAARATLLREVEASAGAGFSGSPARTQARYAVGLQLASDSAGDEAVQTEAAEAAMRLATRVAMHPGANMGDIGCKLALLVRHLLADAEAGLDGVQEVRLYLAASALADCALLDGRAIELPRDIGEPIEDADDVARLRARAGRLS
jgi:hypothetical protein